MTVRNTMAGTARYFSRIERFNLPTEVFEETVKHLREEGRFLVESIVFWLGSVQGSTATLSSLVVPQGLGVFKHALQVRVSEDLIARLGELVDPPRLVLLGQVHTHMHEAFHSFTDDRHSIGTLGYISLVVPDFAKGQPSEWRSWGFYECEGPASFRRLPAAEIGQRFVVKPKGGLSIHVIEG